MGIPDSTNREELEEIFKKMFLEKSLKEWCGIFDWTDAGISPGLPLLRAAKESNPIFGLSQTPSLDVSDRTVIEPEDGSDRILQNGWDGRMVRNMLCMGKQSNSEINLVCRLLYSYPKAILQKMKLVCRL